MQHDHVPKKLNFDVLTPHTKSTQGVWHRSSIKIPFDMFLVIVTLSACEISVKNNDN